MNSSMRIWQRAVIVAALALLSTLANCSDSTRAGGDGLSHLDPRLRGILVSGPLSSSGHASAASAAGAVGPASAAGAAGASADSQVVYVSLPSGSVVGGDSALIHAASRASTTTRAPMIDGGFDPVAIYANADDSLDVAVFANDRPVVGLFRVPAFRQPSVIRTTPGRGRTDVPLSQIITIVFSQPIADSSVTGSSVKLVDDNGVVVATTISFDAERPWVVLLTPQASLATNTTYRFVVDATVTDINGAALAAPLTSTFTTASSSSSSDLLVLSRDGCSGGFLCGYLGSAMEATVGATVSSSAYRVTLGDTVSYAPQGLGWSTADTRVATVDSSGTVTAIAAGQTIVSACLNRTCGHADILVHAVQTTGAPAIDIDSLAGGDYSEITSMAGEFATGTALFQSSAGRRLHAFLWSASRGMEDLGSPVDRPLSNGEMVATNGDVIGLSDNAIWWRWTRATGIQAMPNPDLAHTWRPMAINGLGEIAYSTPDGSRIGFWSPTTAGTEASAPGVSVFVQGMNDAAQMVVFESSAQYYWFPDTTAYVWDAHAGHYTDTLTTNGAIPGFAWTIWPSAINNLGVVAGIVWGATETRMFRWSRGKGFSFLTVPNGSMTLHGPALNDAGDVTFVTAVTTNLSTGSIAEGGAGVWMADGKVVALQPLGGTFTEVTGVSGQSLAGGFSQVGSSSGPAHAVLWNLKAAPSPGGAKASREKSAPSRVVAPARTAATPKPSLPPPTFGRPP